MPKITQSQEFKDSPLGKIPGDWEVCPIEVKLLKIIDYRGKTPEKTNSGIPLITAKNVRDGYLDIEPREYIYENDYDIWMRRGIPSSGDILFTTEAPLGNVAKVPDYKIALAQRLLTLIANPSELDSNYLLWVLQWVDSRHRLEQRSSGSTVLGIKQSVFRRVLFRFPPIEQQRQIAEILDTIDSTIAHTSTLIAKLKQMKAGLLHDLLTRGLDENGKLRDAIGHPEQFKDSPLGQIPKDWEVHPLGKFTHSSAFGPRFSSEEYDDDGNVATLRTTDMDEEGNLDLSTMPLAKLNLDAFRLHLLEPGDLLVSRSGTCGITAVFPGYELPVLPGAFLIRFRLNQGLLANFVQRYLNSKIGRKRVLDEAEGGVQKNLRGSTLLRLLLPIPTESEQKAILQCLDAHEARICAEETYLNKLKEQKKGLMHDLLTGRVRVTDLKEIPA